MNYIQYTRFWNKLGSENEIQNSGLGVNGTITGTINYTQCSFNCGSYANTGTNFISFPNFLMEDINYGQKFTFDFWFKTNWNCVNGVPSNNTNSTFFDIKVDANNRIFLIANPNLIPAGLNYKYIRNKVVTNWISTVLNWTANSLHHFALVQNSTTSKIYVDGILQDSHVGTFNPISGTAINYLMAYASTGSFDGVIDDLVIYNIDKTDFVDRIYEGRRSYTRLQNKTKGSSVEVKTNFELIGSENLLPRGGTNLDYTTGVYNLGSDSYKWNNLYSNNFDILNGITDTYYHIASASGTGYGISIDNLNGDNDIIYKFIYRLYGRINGSVTALGFNINGGYSNWGLQNINATGSTLYASQSTYYGDVYFIASNMQHTTSGYFGYLNFYINGIIYGKSDSEKLCIYDAFSYYHDGYTTTIDTFRIRKGAFINSHATLTSLIFNGYNIDPMSLHKLDVYTMKR